jgi:hypothetical protein
VTVEAGDEELGLGLIEARAVLPTRHEVDRLLQVPGALGFVEDGHVFDRRLLYVDAAVATDARNGELEVDPPV